LLALASLSSIAPNHEDRQIIYEEMSAAEVAEIVRRCEERINETVTNVKSALVFAVIFY
jgi:hypothetical protein